MILETLYILFRGDTSDLKKKRQEAEKETDKVNKKLSSTKKASDEIGNSLSNVAKQFANIAFSALTVSAILGDFKRIVTDSIGLAQFSRNTQTSIGELNTWGQALRRVGGTAEEFKGNLMALAESTGGSPEIALQLLPAFAKAFVGLNQMQARQVGQGFGLSDNMIALLRQPKLMQAAIEQQQKMSLELEKINPDILAFNDSLMESDTSLRTLAIRLEGDLLPVLTTMIKVFKEFTDNIDKGEIEGGLGAIGIAAAVLGRRLIIPTVELTALISSLGLLGMAFADLDKEQFTWLDSMVEKITKAVPLVGSLMYGLGYVSLGAWHLVNGTTYKNFKDAAYSERLNSNQDFLDSETGTQNLLGYIKNLGSNPFSNNQAGLWGGSSNSANIHIGEISVNTAATDADGISQDIGQSLRDGIGHLINFYNNGINA